MNQKLQENAVELVKSSISYYYYEYNNFNQLAKVRQSNATGTVIEEYMYDHEGNRILKKNFVINETTFYISNNFIRVSNSSGTFDTVYYYDEKDLVARKDPDGKKFFYHPDHLGSTTLVTNESGDVVEETTYEPFGKIIEGGNDRFLYTGKELDKSTELEYYGARYYSPELGRFVEPDSNLPNVYDPQQLNRYSYVRNNPLKYTDPDGNQFMPFNPILFGETSIGYLPQGLQVLGRNDVIPSKELFRNSNLAEQLKSAGYRNLDEFPSDSPIHSVTRQWKSSGMAKELEEGKWSAIRWDVGKPESPVPSQQLPHANQHLFRPDAGTVPLKEIAKGPLDHFPLFSQSGSVSSGNEYEIYRDTTNSVKQSSYTSIQRESITLGGRMMSVLKSLFYKNRQRAGIGNNNICGTAMSCHSQR